MAKKNLKLQEELKKYFGFDTFKNNQEVIIQNLLDGKDSFVLMPTGGGKSLCYQLPSLLMDGTAIVISPLIALMKNQVDAMRNYSEEDGIAHFINSSLTKAAIEQVKSDIISKKTKLLYVAPESLSKQENIDFLKGIKISFYAIDEAHCISEWGHDFRPEYRKIRADINEIGVAPIIALTATATPKVQHDILKSLEIPDANIYKSSFNRSNLYYEIRPKTKDVDKDIIKFIKSNPNKSGIIYCLSRQKVEDLAKKLEINGIKALPYHAGMDSQTRSANQDKFINEDINVIVATIAFGMGIDKPDVRFVIHYDIPKSLEGYYQETGRAGRDGGEGICLAFYAREDLDKLEKFMQNKPVAEQEIGKQLLAETASYAETTLCRRKFLLNYFGEDYPEDDCGNCDNCKNPKHAVECKEELVAILELVVLLKEKFKAEHIINILLGNKTKDVEQHGHDELENYFKAFPKMDKLTLDIIIHQAMIEGLLNKDIENYGLLKITSKGKDYLKRPKSFKVMLSVKKSNDDDDDDDDEYDDIDASSAASGGGVADEVLFSMLKDLRKKVAKANNVPPYVVFQDPSLEAMVTLYPISMDELQNIPGVGAGKAKRYGKEFVELIKKYVEENDITRPEDIRVKSVANKSKQKIAIIQAIDRKIALDDIAVNNNLDIGEFLDELESIVDSGTKINIDYFIYDVMDEDRVDEVYEYFKEAETPDLQAAIEELGPEAFTEEEIRFVRIKFMCDLAN